MKKQIISLLLIFSLSGCTLLQAKADDSQATNEGINALVEANNNFAIEFYNNITNSEDGNVFFSPYSISTALSMVYEGAGGETAEEIRSVFYLPEDDTIRRSSAASTYNNLNKWSNKYTLSTANALWLQKDYPFLEEYVKVIQDYYVAEANNMDFINNTEESRVTINNWVESKTNNKIKDLLNPGTITELTRLVLTNAIYFKGDWLKQFDKANTREEEFYLNDGSIIKAPLMRITDDEAKFNYGETKHSQILEIPYEGEELSMIIILPKNNIAELENNLSIENLNTWMNNLTQKEVRIYLPKFKFDTKYSLKDKLASMGMPAAFNPAEADLSGMDGKRDLYISSVIHQAFVEVDEEGTEAAAATAVVVTMGSVISPHEIFRADHPFIFLIKEENTNNILFMGRVMNPTE